MALYRSLDLLKKIRRHFPCYNIHYILYLGMMPLAYYLLPYALIKVWVMIVDGLATSESILEVKHICNLY